MTRNKDQSSKIAAHIFTACICFALIISGLYLVLVNDRAREALWLNQAAQAYAQKAQAQTSEKSKQTYNDGARQAQIQAIQDDPYNPALWESFAKLLEAEPATEEARSIAKALSPLKNEKATKSFLEEFP